MNKRYYEHTLPIIRGSLSNTYVRGWCGHWEYSEKVYVESEQGYVSIEIELPKGSVYKLLGKELTWDDEPVELQTETEKR